MKKLILILALLCSCPAWATITDVQHPAGTVNSSSTTCNVTITANGTGAQRLLIYKIASDSGHTLSSVTGGGTWTQCGTNCNQSDATAGATNIAYLNAPGAAVTTITGTLNSSSGSLACWVEEYSTDQAGFTVETTSASNKICDVSGCTSNCTSCASPGPTITGTNDVVSSVSSCGSTCSGTITNWNALYAGGDGSAHRVNTISTSFNWAQSPTAHLASSSIAFFDVAGGGGSTAHPRAQVIQSRNEFAPSDRIKMSNVVAFDKRQRFIAHRKEYAIHPRLSAIRANNQLSIWSGQPLDRPQPTSKAESAGEAQVVSSVTDSATRPDEIKMLAGKLIERPEMVSLPAVRERFQAVVSIEPRFFLDKGAFTRSQVVPDIETVSISGANIQTAHSGHVGESNVGQERTHLYALCVRVLTVEKELFRLVEFGQALQLAA
jgi:hypothetical protein